MQTGGAKKRIGENNEKRHQDYYQYLECVGGILFTVVSVLFIFFFF